MFRSTRLKLTAWYLLIIMLISVIFSAVLYFNVERELTRFEEFQKISEQRVTADFGNFPLPRIGVAVDQQLIKEAKGRLLTNLAIFNILILIGAGAAGYFLAGRTLRPIRRMLDDQARFIGDASHELKTPLTALRSEIEIYLRGKKRTLKEANIILKSNLEEVERLQKLSEGLMELTSYGRMSDNLEFTETSLHEVLSEAIRNVVPLAKGKHINLVNKAVEIDLLADSKTLIGLFTILLDNAIKYSKKNSKVTILSEIQERLGVIQIKDQGVGIELSEQAKIFDRFYRVDKSRTKSSTTGYGLGLSIAKEMVSLHKGRISVKSSKRGSVFTVEIPLS